MPNPSLNLTHSYTTRIRRSHALIIGPLPPPHGGVSVHIKRVAQRWEQQGISVTVIDRSTSSRLQRYWQLISGIVRNRHAHLYVHTLYNSIFEWLIAWSLALLMRMPLTVVEHDCRFLARRSYATRLLLCLTVRFVDEQIFMGPLTLEHYQKYGLPIVVHHTIESPYLPPPRHEFEKIYQQYPATLHAFLTNRAPRVAVCAFAPHHDGKDLYGIGFTLECIAHLKKIYPNIGCVFALATHSDAKIFMELQQQARDLAIAENCFWLTGSHELWPLLGSVDLFLRPTLSDNFGISMQEALDMGTPVVASDAVPRPEGVVTYRSGNVEDAVIHLATSLDTSVSLRYISLRETLRVSG